MIRDCLVVSIQDITLYERMQMDTDLTLEKAKKLAHQHEAVQEYKELLCKAEKQSMIDHIQHKTTQWSSTTTSHAPPRNKNTQSQQTNGKDVVINHMLTASALPKIQCVINARERVTTVASVSLK